MIKGETHGQGARAALRGLPGRRGRAARGLEGRELLDRPARPPRSRSRCRAPSARARRRRSDSAGCSGPKTEGKTAHFYTIVSRDTVDADFAAEPAAVPGRAGVRLLDPRRRRLSMDAQEVADAFALGRASSLSHPWRAASSARSAASRPTTAPGRSSRSSSLSMPMTWPRFEVSAAYHRACWESGIPTPEPIRARSGSSSSGLRRARARLHLGPPREPDTGLDPAAVGALLARLHAVPAPPRGRVHEWFEAPIGGA